MQVILTGYDSFWKAIAEYLIENNINIRYIITLLIALNDASTSQPSF